MSGMRRAEHHQVWVSCSRHMHLPWGSASTTGTRQGPHRDLAMSSCHQDRARLGSAAAQSKEPNASGRDVAQHITAALPGQVSGVSSRVVPSKYPASPCPLFGGPLSQTFAPTQPHEAVCQASQYKSINVCTFSITLLHPQGQI